MSNVLVTPLTVAHQAPLATEFPKQEYCSGLLFPYPGDLPNPGTETVYLALAGRFFTPEPPPETTLLLLLSRFSRVRLCATP